MLLSGLCWQDLFGKWGTLFKRRYGWGDSIVDERNEKTMPDIIRNVGDEVSDMFRSTVPDLPTKFTSCTANRYPVGEGLGAHKDGPAWEPYVLGVTIGSSRHMQFRSDSGEKLTFLTKRCSAYIFWSDMYTDWYHSSMKGSNSGKYFQPGTAYSLTFRSARKVRPLHLYEHVQSRLWGESVERVESSILNTSVAYKNIVKFKNV